MIYKAWLIIISLILGIELAILSGLFSRQFPELQLTFQVVIILFCLVFLLSFAVVSEPKKKAIAGLGLLIVGTMGTGVLLAWM